MMPVDVVQRAGQRVELGFPAVADFNVRVYIKSFQNNLRFEIDPRFDLNEKESIEVTVDRIEEEINNYKGVIRSRERIKRLAANKINVAKAANFNGLVENNRRVAEQQQRQKIALADKEIVDADDEIDRIEEKIKRIEAFAPRLEQLSSTIELHFMVVACTKQGPIVLAQFGEPIDLKPLLPQLILK